MLGKCVKYLFVLPLIVTVTILSTVAWADSTTANYDPCAGIKPITKVKPNTPPEVPTPPMKVKPWSSLAPNFGALSQYSPLGWGPDCCLPTPAKASSSSVRRYGSRGFRERPEKLGRPGHCSISIQYGGLRRSPGIQEKRQRPVVSRSDVSVAAAVGNQVLLHAPLYGSNRNTRICFHIRRTDLCHGDFAPLQVGTLRAPSRRGLQCQSDSFQ